MLARRFALRLGARSLPGGALALAPLEPHELAVLVELPQAIAKHAMTTGVMTGLGCIDGS